jgi:hypothetical protein
MHAYVSVVSHVESKPQKLSILGAGKNSFDAL